MKLSILRKIIKEEVEKAFNKPTGMSLDIAKQRGKDIHGRQYSHLPPD